MPTDLVLSPDQDKAVEAILAFWRKGRGQLTIGGLAGVGKSTILAHAVKTWKKAEKHKRFAFAALTGKAAEVLRMKLEAADINPDYCGTIHRMMYTPIENKETSEIKWEKTGYLDYDFIVIDEASMVNSEIYFDLRSFHKPMLFCGDHGQLPPVSGNFNLMDKPDIKLEKIHRQAENSPIIKVAMMARQDGYIPLGEYGPYVRKVDDWDILSKIKDVDECMVICNFNNTRVIFNDRIRQLLGILSREPVVDDKVICLRNRADVGLYNGMLGSITRIDDDTENSWNVDVDFDGGQSYGGRISKSQFGQPTTLKTVPGHTKDDPIDLFDYGYAVTCHKAQGSQAKRVIVFEQRSSFMDDDLWRRWLYTAVSRSEERLLVVGS